MLALSLTAAYLISLPGIEAESPSSLITFKVRDSTATGATHDDLATVITDEIFVLNRLEGLVTENLVEVHDGRYFITPSGQSFLNLFLIYHRWSDRLKHGG